MRKMKRIVSFALAACMAASLLATGPVIKVSAAEPEEVVTAEVSATETDSEALDETQEVVYDESEADVDGFVWNGTTLVKYVGEGGDVKIPEKCISIGFKAFSDCSGLTNIEIPSSVTSIGWGAFWDCSGLTNIEIPTSVTSIGDYAFWGCSGLTSIEIPTGVTSIGEETFYDCSGLTSIEIPTSVTSIGSDAFSGCSGLTSIEIPKSVTSIGDNAFYFCSGLTSIVVSLENSKYNSVGNCNAIIETETNILIKGCENTKIPSSVTSIGEGAFSGCSGLTNIEIPTSVTSIGGGHFRAVSA